MNRYYIFDNTAANLALLLNDVNAGRIIGGTANPNVCSMVLPDRVNEIKVNAPTGFQFLFPITRQILAAEVAEPAPEGLQIPTSEILTLEQFQALDKVQVCEYTES